MTLVKSMKLIIYNMNSSTLTKMWTKIYDIANYKYLITIDELLMGHLWQ